MKNNIYIYNDESFYEKTVKQSDIYSLAYDNFSNSLVPILDLKDFKRKIYDPIGTSLYVQFRNRKYLITAKHVSTYSFYGQYTENSTHAVPQIPLNSEFIGSIPCLKNGEKFICTKTVDDDLDIAIYPLEQNLELFTAIEVGVSFPKMEKSSFLCMGYPSTRFKNENYFCKSQLVSFIGPKGDVNPITQKTEINQCFGAVKFLKDKCFDTNKNLLQFPDPHGLSGGIAIGFNSDLDSLCLAGIITSYETERTKNRVLNFTRIENILKIFESRYNN